MHEGPANETRTTTAFLMQLRGPADEIAWEKFVRMYQPILVGFARARGFCADDAGDLAQEAMARFLPAWRAGNYRRDHGRLRSWLVGILKHAATDLARLRRRERTRGIVCGTAGGSEDRLWETARRRAMLREALERVRARPRVDPRTVLAFEMLSLGGRSAAEVAEQLGMTVEDVWAAKSRTVSRIREELACLESEYGETP